MSGNIPASPFHSPPPLVRLRLEKPQAHADRATGVGLLEKPPDPEATDAEAGEDSGIVVPARPSQATAGSTPRLAREAPPPLRDVSLPVVQTVKLGKLFGFLPHCTVRP